MGQDLSLSDRGGVPLSPSRIEVEVPRVVATGQPSDPVSTEMQTGALPGLVLESSTEQSAQKVLSRSAEVVGSEPPLVHAWRTVLTKLFVSAKADKQHLVYDGELATVERARGDAPNTLLAKALDELQARQFVVVGDTSGGIANPQDVGESFAAVYKLATQKVDVAVATNRKQLLSDDFPLSSDMARDLMPIIKDGHAAIVMLVKEPPVSAAQELRTIADERFGGLISLWQHRELWERIGVSAALRDYLNHATVRVVTTASDPALKQLAKGVNIRLEREGGFEDAQWTTVVKGVTQGDRHHALKEALTVCGPVVIGVKALESFAPGLMHTVGGALDDLFGAILPDVSQSMGKKGAPFMERMKDAWPVLKAGLASLPLAMGCGWLAATLYAGSTSLAVHALSGGLFALACSLGTLGTSLGAYRKASQSIEKLRSDPVVGEHIETLGSWGRMKLALQESIFDVPFRVGHTVIGVPLQFALGITAGVGGFFHNGLFVMAEGMLETLLGAGTAFGYPSLKRAYDRWKLKRV